jgi:hypothetical protein
VVGTKTRVAVHTRDSAFGFLERVPIHRPPLRSPSSSLKAKNKKKSSKPITHTRASDPQPPKPPGSQSHQTRGDGAGVGGAGVRGGRGGDHAAAADAAGPRRPPPGLDLRRARRAQADDVRRALLPLPAHGHLLEVRDAAHLQRRPRLHALRAPPPPQVHHEVAAQRAPHRRRAAPLLDPLLCHPARRQARRPAAAPRQVEEARRLICFSSVSRPIVGLLLIPHLLLFQLV